jgi:murein DD-endopeptidase MepM/ murein hydrolase activator NlpD
MSRLNAHPPAQTRHRFCLTFTAGKRERTLALSPTAFYVIFGLIPLLGIWYLFATFYLVFRDDMLASLMQRQTASQYAYEAQINGLHGQIDQLTQRRLLDEATLRTKLNEVTMRQSRLEQRSNIVAELTERLQSGKDSIETTKRGSAAEASVNSQSPTGQTPNPLLNGAFSKALPKDVSPKDVSAFAPAAVSHPQRSLPGAATNDLPHSDASRNDKPRPESFDLRRSEDPESGPSTHTDQSSDMRDFGDGEAALRQLTASLDAIERGQNRLVANLQTPLIGEVVRVRTVLADAGLSAERFAGPPSQDAPVRPEIKSSKVSKAAAMGGPFVPMTLDTDESAFDHEAGVLQKAIAEAEHLRRVLSNVPLRKPLAGDPEITSGFGARTDPFLGRAAMHTGIDLREDYGTDIHATADGKVVNAGPEGGYGNMVEIDHGNGLTTRYAHMASLCVVEGQMVKAGQIVGRIGMTGRTTGPHLHYEVRIDGEPVDPLRFLKVGDSLSRQVPEFVQVAPHML